MSDRLLRATTLAARDGGPASNKKRKKAPARYLCTSCDEQLPSSALPDYNPSTKCAHMINTCSACLKAWVDVQVGDGNFTSVGDEIKGLAIRCPECPELMLRSDIWIAARGKIYQRFNELDRRHTAEHTPAWHWCLGPDCRAGQIHEAPMEAKPASRLKPLLSSSVSSDNETITVAAQSIMECHKCGFQTCVTCDRPWHDGETCKEYQARTKDRLDEENKTIAKILKITNRCPGCKTKIEKNGGCAHMMCVKCTTSFCWKCLHTYNQGRCKC